MLKVNESATIRLANAQSQLRRRTAASIVPKPIAYRRQKFNAIASTIPARSTDNEPRSSLLLPLQAHLNPRFPPTIRLSLTASQVLRRPPEVT